MKVNFFSLNQQYLSIENQIKKEINKVLKNQDFIQGESVQQFEKAFAEMNNSKYCVAVNSGTAALHIAYAISDFDPSDEILVPTNSFFSTAEAVSLANLKPVFVDADKSYHHINLEDAKNKITKNTKAIVPVHLYGNPVNMDEILKFSKLHGLKVIEDCAQAHFSTFRNKIVGNFGSIGCFSFYPSKNLGAYGEGGALVTNNKRLYERAILFRNHGSKKRYVHESIGHNYRLNSIQGAVLNVKLKHINKSIDQRIKLANVYHQKIEENSNTSLPKINKDSKHVYHLFVIRHKQRDKLKNYLLENGIETSLHYPIPIHKQPAYKSRIDNYQKMEYDQTAKEILSLPMYPELTEKKVAFVADKINEFNLSLN